jgi:hypothetical protein
MNAKTAIETLWCIGADLDHNKYYRKEIGEIVSLIESFQLPPDKIVIHKDELDRMKQNMAEKDRQTEECYTIMKFEQVRANKAIDTLNAVLLYGKECPECKAQVIVDQHFYSLQHREPCEIGKLAGMSIAR